MKFVKIDETNKEDFAYVLPQELIDGLGVSIGAVEDDTVCGAAALSFDGEDYSIDWLYVVPSRRRMGIASGLIKEIRTMVSFIGIFPIRMMVNASDDSGVYPFVLSVEDEDNPINIIYSHDRYVITPQEFADSDILETVSGEAMITSYETELFWQMEKEDRNQALSMISGIFSIYDEDKFADTCEKELCLVEKKGDQTEAFALVQREEDTVLKLSFLYSQNPKALASLLQEISAMLEEYADIQTIYFEPVTGDSKLLAQKLFPNVKKEAIYEVEL